jgi:Tfp pilus assembly protein FimT
MSPTETSRTFRRAFTFIELLVIIAIIGALAAVSVPRMRRNFIAYEKESFVRDIYYLAEYLKGAAVAQNGVFRMDIDPQAGSFQGKVRRSTDGQAAKFEFVVLGGRFGRVYTAPSGLSFTIEPERASAVTFYPDGSAQNGESAQTKIKFSGDYLRPVALQIQGETGEIALR